MSGYLGGGAEEGVRAFRARVTGYCETPLWMLGTKLDSSARSANALICWAVSPAPRGSLNPCAISLDQNWILLKSDQQSYEMCLNINTVTIK